MKSCISLVLALMLVTTDALAENASLDATKQWPQWRGPLGNGLAPHANPPIEWSEDRNLRWKVPLPGKGLSTPIVWSDRVYVTTAEPFGDKLPKRQPDPHGAHDNVPASYPHRFLVIAFDRQDGHRVWQRTVHAGQPHESTHESGSWASNSPVTDGEHLIASFGSQGIFGLDMTGEVLWQIDVGPLHTKHGHGEGSSPALYGDTVVVNCDHEAGSFVIALDKCTGRQRWKATRDEGTSWSSPLIVSHAGREQVIVAATRRVRAYDLVTGDLIWSCGGLSGNVVASPVVMDGIVYVANSYETRNLLAIRLVDARGDVTGSDAVAWTRHRDTPYVPSPLAHDGRLYFLKHYQGILTCLNAQSGAVQFGPQRLTGIQDVYASPVTAADRLYIVSRNGATAVISCSNVYKPLALNRLDDSFSASPAVAGDDLILRGDRYLYCLSAGAGTDRPSP